MKRALLILGAAALAVAALVSSAGASAPPPYSAQLTACKARAGKIFVDGYVAPIRGAKRLGLRFELERRAPRQSAFARVPVDPELGLGVWDTFRASSAVREHKSVSNIQLPGIYRMRVGFRWYGARAKVLRTRVQVSHGCRVPDRRPNLRVTGVDVSHVDGNPTRDRYALRVQNTGLAAAEPFAVGLTTSSGNHMASRMLAKPLPGHGSRLVVIVAARCSPADPPTATADSDGAVSETNEGDNRFKIACPTP